MKRTVFLRKFLANGYIKNGSEPGNKKSAVNTQRSQLKRGSKTRKMKNEQQGIKTLLGAQTW